MWFVSYYACIPFLCVFVKFIIIRILHLELHLCANITMCFQGGRNKCYICIFSQGQCSNRDDVIKWKHFPRYWPLVRGIRRSPVNSPHKGQWRRALKSSLICVWINDWVNNRDAGDLRCHHAHHDVTVLYGCNWHYQVTTKCNTTQLYMQLFRWASIYIGIVILNHLGSL